MIIPGRGRQSLASTISWITYGFRLQFFQHLAIIFPGCRSRKAPRISPIKNRSFPRFRNDSPLANTHLHLAAPFPAVISAAGNRISTAIWVDHLIFIFLAASRTQFGGGKCVYQTWLWFWASHFPILWIFHFVIEAGLEGIVNICMYVLISV